MVTWGMKAMPFVGKEVNAYFLRTGNGIDGRAALKKA